MGASLRNRLECWNDLFRLEKEKIAFRVYQHLYGDKRAVTLGTQHTKKSNFALRITVRKSCKEDKDIKNNINMKKKLFILCSFIMCLTANAQTGFNIGAVFESQKEIQTLTFEDLKVIDTTTQMDGFYFDIIHNIHFTEYFGVEPALRVMYTNWNETTTLGDMFSESSLNKINLAVPVMLNYQIPLWGKTRLGIYAGPTFDVCIKYDDTHSNNDGSQTESILDKAKDRISYSRFDILAEAGLGLMFNHFGVHARYAWGLFNHAEAPDNAEFNQSEYEANISRFYVGVTISF